MSTLKKNSALRIQENKNYQSFLKELKKNDDEAIEEETAEEQGTGDLQLHETYNVMKDLLYLMQ
jgi:carboxyl-terminal processing protease